MINRVSFLTLSLVLSLTISLSQAQFTKSQIDSLRQKAEQGNAKAQCGLGLLYYKGQGVPQVRAEAVKWYQKAAEQGDAECQYLLGRMYLKGKGVPQDYKEAVKWFLKAAKQGGVGAQYDLGLVYARGQGVPKDYVKAHMWANLGASGLKGEGRENAVKLRDLVAKLLTQEQISESQRLAREWVEKHQQ